MKVTRVGYYEHCDRHGIDFRCWKDGETGEWARMCPACWRENERSVTQHGKSRSSKERG